MISYPGCGAYMRVVLISVPDHVSKRLLYVGANSNNDDICVLFSNKVVISGSLPSQGSQGKVREFYFSSKSQGIVREFRLLSQEIFFESSKFLKEYQNFGKLKKIQIVRG